MKTCFLVVIATAALASAAQATDFVIKLNPAPRALTVCEKAGVVCHRLQGRFMATQLKQNMASGQVDAILNQLLGSDSSYECHNGDWHRYGLILGFYIDECHKYRLDGFRFHDLLGDWDLVGDWTGR